MSKIAWIIVDRTNLAPIAYGFWALLAKSLIQAEMGQEQNSLKNVSAIEFSMKQDTNMKFQLHNYLQLGFKAHPHIPFG